MPIAATACHPTPDPLLEARSRRRWIAMILGLFGLQAVLWTTALLRVHDDPSHAVVANYDQRALAWDVQRAEQRASDALGWTAAVSLQPSTSDERGRVRVTLTDTSAAPVRASGVEATLFHRGTAAHQQVITLIPLGEGQYGARAQIERTGLWRVQLRAVRGSDVFVSSVTTAVGVPVQGAS